MIDGLYENGNCISGSVSYYTKLNSEFRLKNGEAEKTISKVMYWENSKQIAQQQTILLKKYGRELIGQQNFDKSGKLIQKLTNNSYPSRSYYNEKMQEGIAYEYYTINDCAINVKSESRFLSGKKNGTFINYDISGKIINKIIYKNDLPFEGLLEENINHNLYVFTNYKNSLKEGEEIVKTQNDSIISKGIYKLGKPFRGQFISENEHNSEYQLKNYDNFVENGLQQILDNENKVIKFYFLENGLKEGIITTIDENNNKNEIEYKNDLPFNGIFKTETSETIYKNGNLVSETEFRQRNHDEILVRKEYENGKITKVISSKFNIYIKEKKYVDDTNLLFNSKNLFIGYVGIYKDGNPFSGYFENERGKYKTVNYYENGIAKFQYSKDWFSSLAESLNQSSELNLESTFVDGKIVDGNEYFDYGKIEITKKFQNGNLKTLDIDFFEVNYFNRLHYEIKNNVIEIFDMQNKDLKLLLDMKDNKINSKLVVKDKIIETTKSEFIKINDVFMPNSVVTYFEGENEILTENESLDKKPIFEIYNEYKDAIIFKGYTFVPMDSKSKNTTELFSEIGAQFVLEEDDMEKVFKENFEEKNYKLIANLRIDKNQKPETGMWIIKNPDNTYLFKLYSKGKLIITKDRIAFKNCYSEAKKLKNSLKI